MRKILVNCVMKSVAFAAVIFGVAVSSANASPIFQITTPSAIASVSAGGVASVTYTIKNVSGIDMPMMRYFPPASTSISTLPSTCGTTLANLASCQLVLNIQAPQNSGSLLLAPLSVCGFGGKVCSAANSSNRVRELVGSFSNAFVGNFNTNLVSVLSLQTNTIIGSPIITDQDPISIAITPDGTKAFVVSQDEATVAVIDTLTNQRIGSLITIPGTATAQGIAITPDGSRAYVGGLTGNIIAIIDTTTNTFLSSIVAQGTSPNAIAITPDGRTAYIANLTSNNVSVLDIATGTFVGAAIAVGNGPRDVKVTPDGSKVYVANTNNLVSVISTASNTVIASIPVTTAPQRIAITPDGSKAYVTASTSNTVSVIDTTTDTVVGLPIAVGTFPVGIAITPDGSKAYVTNRTANTVSIIDIATNTVIGSTITGFTQPIVIAITP